MERLEEQPEDSTAYNTGRLRRRQHWQQRRRPTLERDIVEARADSCCQGPALTSTQQSVLGFNPAAVVTRAAQVIAAALPDRKRQHCAVAPLHPPAYAVAAGTQEQQEPAAMVVQQHQQQQQRRQRSLPLEPQHKGGLPLLPPTTVKKQQRFQPCPQRAQLGASNNGCSVALRLMRNARCEEATSGSAGSMGGSGAACEAAADGMPTAPGKRKPAAAAPLHAHQLRLSSPAMTMPAVKVRREHLAPQTDPAGEAQHRQVLQPPRLCHSHLQSSQLETACASCELCVQDAAAAPFKHSMQAAALASDKAGHAQQLDLLAGSELGHADAGGARAGTARHQDQGGGHLLQQQQQQQQQDGFAPQNKQEVASGGQHHPPLLGLLSQQGHSCQLQPTHRPAPSDQPFLQQRILPGQLQVLPVQPAKVLVDLVALADTPQGRALGFPEMMVAFVPAVWDNLTAQQRADRVGVAAAVATMERRFLPSVEA